MFPKPNGIPVGDIREVVLDPSGAVWLASWGDGLHRIFETEWNAFYEEDGLPDDWVKAATIDEHGVIWVGTGEGLCTISNGKVTDIYPDIISVQEFVSLCTIDERRICAVTSSGNGYIIEMDPTTSRPVGYLRIADAENYNNIEPWDTIALPDGRLMVSLREDGIYEYVDGVWQEVYGVHDTWSFVHSTGEYTHPKAWIVGLYTGKVLQFDGNAIHELGELGIPAYCGAVSPEGTLWIGTENGIRTYSNAGWQTLDLGYNIGNPSVQSIQFEGDERVWIGTNEGLILGRKPIWKGKHRSQDGNEIRLLVSGPPPGSALIGIDSKHNLLRRSNDRWESICTLDSQEAFIKCWLVPDNSTVWALTHTSMVSFDSATGNVLQQLLLPTTIDILENECFFTTSGEFWLMTSIGAFRLDDTVWTPIFDKDIETHWEAYTAIELAENEFYVGVYTGIEHWKDDVLLENITLERGFPQTMGIHSIWSDTNGTYYFGTFGEGIFEYDGEKLRQLADDETLLSSMISSIYKASDGTLWVTFRHTGVASYRDGRWVNYTLQQGLPNSAVMSIHEDEQGSIWLSTRTEGILNYIPDLGTPETYIEAAPGRIPSHGVGVFSFSGRDAFLATAEDSLLYSWRIIPEISASANIPWSPFSRKHIAIPPALKPGKYVFEVRASDRERNVDSTPARYTFHVQFPIWRHPAVLVPVFLIALLFGTVIILRMRKTALEREHLRSASQLQAVTMNTPGAVYQRRLEQSNGMIFISDAVEEITGYPPEHFITPCKISLDMLLSTQSREHIHTSIHHQLDEKGRFEIEYLIRREDGEARWISDRGRLTEDSDGGDPLIDGILIDVTKERVLAEELKSSHEKLEEKVHERTAELTRVNEQLLQEIDEREKAEREKVRLFTAIEQSEAIVLITDTDGTIQYVNPAFEQTTGFSKREAIGKKPSLLKSGRHDQVFYADLWETITRGETWHGSFINRKKDGSLLEEEATVSPVIDASGKIINFVGMKHDVTARKELERQLFHVQKLDILSRLTGGMAHDFKNFLALISGYTEISQGMLDDDHPAKECIDHVMKASNRARKVVDQALVFSRKGEGNPKPVQIETIVNDALEIFLPSLPATIHSSIDIADDIGLIFADPGLLQQVIINIYTNSLQAMKEHGGLLQTTLTTTELESNSPYELSGRSKRTYVMLTIRDTGPGMDSDILPRVFEPFFTTKKKAEGTGLGLAIAQRIITDCGGKIDVDSEPGKGTTFNIYLPQYLGEMEILEKAGISVHRGNSRIMIVDDDEDIVEMNRKGLMNLGYRVSPYSDSLEALEAFRNAPDNYDLLITDHKMPGMLGIQLAREVRTIRPEFPIIIVSATEEDLSRRVAKIGINEYLCKPITPNALAHAIYHCLNKDDAGVEVQET